jgi:hypothetical protein
MLCYNNPWSTPYHQTGKSDRGTYDNSFKMKYGREKGPIASKKREKKIANSNRLHKKENNLINVNNKIVQIKSKVQ